MFFYLHFLVLGFVLHWDHPETSYRQIHSAGDRWRQSSSSDEGKTKSQRKTKPGEDEKLTPLQGPSKSSLRYLLSRDILLPGVNDIWNQLGNL